MRYPIAVREMTNVNLQRLGGIFAVIIGILYILMGITFLLLPDEQQLVTNPDFLSSLAERSALSIVQWLAFALIAVLALASVPAISQWIGTKDGGLLHWVTYLAMLGFAVEAIIQFRAIGLMPKIASDFVSGDATTQKAILATYYWGLDPLQIFRFGFVGLWVLIVNLHGLIGSKIPKILGIIGLIGSIAFLAALIGNVAEIVALISVAAVAAIVLGPIWFIWVGVTLLRSETTAES